ncbi:hypothetical protein [Acidianus ambivalens]|nr:hypothetical protein [Acidianus ambivalens]
MDMAMIFMAYALYHYWSNNINLFIRKKNVTTRKLQLFSLFEEFKDVKPSEEGFSIKSVREDRESN